MAALSAVNSEVNEKQPSAIQHKKGAAVIDNIHTDVYVANFTDRLLILCSQFEKLGTLIEVTSDQALGDSSVGRTFTVQTLLGEDDILTSVIARNLAERVSVNKPILFGLALMDKSPAILEKLHTVLQEYRCW